MLSLLTTPGFTENVSPHGLLDIIHTAMHIVQLNKSLLDQLGSGTQKTTEILYCVTVGQIYGSASNL